MINSRFSTGRKREFIIPDGGGVRGSGGASQACGGKPLRPGLGPLGRQRPACAQAAHHGLARALRASAARLVYNVRRCARGHCPSRGAIGATLATATTRFAKPRIDTPIAPEVDSAATGPPPIAEIRRFSSARSSYLGSIRGQFREWSGGISENREGFRRAVFRWRGAAAREKWPKNIGTSIRFEAWRLRC